MRLRLLLAFPLLLSPALAVAQSSGGGTDMHKVNRDIEAMQRDGRWNRLVEEGRSNRQAFEALKDQERPAAVWATDPQARRR